MNAPVEPGMPAAAAPVLVIGEALVDIFPDGSRVVGGAPLNVARWLAVLGVPTQLITRIGAGDAGASAVRASARRCGLSESGLQTDPQRATGRVTVHLGAAGPTYSMDADCAWDHIDAAAAQALAAAAQPTVVVFNTLAQRNAASRAAVHAVLQATPALRFVDLNLRAAGVGARLQELSASALQMADWVKVNDEELAQLLRWFVVPGELPAQASKLQAAQRELVLKFGLQRCVVTCAERGWYLLDADGRCDGRGAAPAVPHMVDTVGAGDAFTAVVVAGLAAKRTLADTVQKAAGLAAAVCGQRGAVPTDDAFLAYWRRELGFSAATWPCLWPSTVND